MASAELDINGVVIGRVHYLEVPQCELVAWYSHPFKRLVPMFGKRGLRRMRWNDARR